MQTTAQKSLALCHAIEAAGASEQLTKCSILASDLLTEIQKIHARDKAMISSLNRYAAECFPEVGPEGQKHFVRVLMESWAEELGKSPAAPDDGCADFKASETDPNFCAHCGMPASHHEGPTPGAPRSFRR